ncbi:MAG: tRNA pseudouridine(55) synthase TruB [Candidatus Mycalebacterium zealandia]|nr:MAG: tRNA pseudouridine(55) synthase TruB [Candidatus Mycalebacterium zealandia]
MNAIVVIDKPDGITSSDVVNRVKKNLKVRKAGHTGTLDKFATGVLPVCLGEATKAIPHLDESFKEYEATMRLGVATDTFDLSGKVTGEGDVGKVSRNDIISRFKENTGTFLQIPPMFSAVKKNGVRLSEIARLGKEVERNARTVTVESLELLEFSPPLVRFSVKCSRGTYVRALASEMGETLGCMAHLVQLRRLGSGKFSIKESATLQDLEAGNFTLISVDGALSHMKSVRIDEDAARIVGSGGFLSATHLSGCGCDFRKGDVVKLMRNGAVASIAEFVADAREVENLKDVPVLKQIRVFGSH